MFARKLLGPDRARNLLSWAERYCSERTARFIIGGDYVHRWYLLPKTKLGKAYLHRICRSDYDRHLHDHPGASVSLILSGKYREITENGVFTREAGDIIVRRAREFHRLEVLGGPVVTLFIMGPSVNNWGFLVDGRKIPHQQYFTEGYHV